MGNYVFWKYPNGKNGQGLLNTDDVDDAICKNGQVVRYGNNEQGGGKYGYA